MEFPSTYFFIERHLFKVSCNRVYTDESNTMFAEMHIEEVEYGV